MKIKLTLLLALFLGFLMSETNAQNDNLLRYEINVYVHTTSNIVLSANTANYKFAYKIERRIKEDGGVVMPGRNYIENSRIVGWAAPGDRVIVHYQLTDKGGGNNNVVKEDQFFYSVFQGESNKANLYFIPEMKYELVTEQNYRYWKNNK